MIDKTQKVWLIARAMPCQERKAEEELNALGFECYVPVQKVKRRWSDRWKIMDKLVIPHYVFVHIPIADKNAIFKFTNRICGFLSDPAKNDKENYDERLATVSDANMNAFKAMVAGVTEGEIAFHESVTFAKGDRVVVTEGPLKGREYELVNVMGKNCIGVFLGSLSAATVEFPTSSLRLVSKG